MNAARTRLAAACVATVLVSGCFSFPENPRLAAVDPERKAGYRFRAVERSDADRTFVVLTLSGGGTRAAALSYGVIQALSKAKLAGRSETLLDEVDVISSVSGGSFAAAWYGVYGRDRFLAEFPEQVLARKIQRDLALRLALPWNWPRLLSPHFGRSDLADRYYDDKIFGGATFASLLPVRRPFIQLNATDIQQGARFSFVQDHFDRLCSDLSGVSVSRGVVASSAFPVVFTPLTLKNRESWECNYKTPRWVENALKRDLERNASRHDRAETWKSYEDPRRKFVHLSDGGLADNLGLRGPLEGLLNPSAELDLQARLNTGGIDRVVIIVADARPEGEPGMDASARPPWIASVLNAAATNPMENYSTETVEQARVFVDRWNAELGDLQAVVDFCDSFPAQACEGHPAPDCAETRRAACNEAFGLEATEPDLGPRVDFHLVYVRFEAEPSCATRQALQRVGTSLQLGDEEVSLVVAAGERLLGQSPAYRKLMQEIGDVTLPMVPEREECPIGQ